MKKLICIIIMLCSLHSFSQKKMHHVFLNERKARIKKYLVKYLQENKLPNTAIAETDSSLSMTINDTAWEKAHFYYHFAKHNKCDAQKEESSCEDCIEKFLKDALADSVYEWQKVNDKMYVSKFSKKVIIDINYDDANDYYLLLRKAKWSKMEYAKFGVEGE